MLFRLRSGALPLSLVVLIGAVLGGCSSDSTSTATGVDDSGIDGSRDAVADRTEVSTPEDTAVPDANMSDADTSEATNPMADAGDSSDSTSGLDAKAPEASAVCAMGPFATNTVSVIDVSTSQPLAGATVKANVCGISDTTAASGKVALMIPVGVESYLRLDAAGKIPTSYPVRTLTSAQSEALVIFTDTYKTGYFPDYDASKAEIFIAIGYEGGATTPCNAYDGVTISVIGHPEAVVTYWTGSTKAVGAIATTAGGTATITGIAAGNQVVLDLKKSGCNVSFDYPNTPASPKLPLETGAVTFFAPRVKN